jgi:hypothetical protein
MIASVVGLLGVVLHSGVNTQITSAPVAVRRAAAPRAALVTFQATRTVSSEPFDANEATLKQWFGESDAVAALCSMADEFKELPSDQVEIVSRIPFPGMTAKSVTVLNVAKDLTAPTYTISTVSSETLCETGPQWVRKLLVSILGATKSTSDNTVSVAFTGASAVVNSEVELKVEINFPFLPLPLGPLQKSGSESLQKVLDTQMAPVLAKFRAGYLAFEKK